MIYDGLAAIADIYRPYRAKLFKFCAALQVKSP